MSCEENNAFDSECTPDEDLPCSAEYAALDTACSDFFGEFEDSNTNDDTTNVGGITGAGGVGGEGC
ncbi:MAG: hypothetical protein R3A47_06195 [Polyangiales bacterium]